MKNTAISLVVNATIISIKFGSIFQLKQHNSTNFKSSVQKRWSGKGNDKENVECNTINVMQQKSTVKALSNAKL